MALKTYRIKQLFDGERWQSDVLVDVSEDGYITALSQFDTESTSLHNEIETVDGFVVPSMINLHSHAFQYAMAGLAEYRKSEQDSFWSWRQLMYQFLEQLTPDDVYLIAKKLYRQMLMNGYTQVGEFHYLHCGAKGRQYEKLHEMSSQLIQAAEDVGIGLTLLPVLYQNSDFGNTTLQTHQQRFYLSFDDYATLLESLQSVARQKTLLNIGLAPHSLRAVDQSALKFLVDLSDSLHACPIHIHIAEQSKEVDACLTMHGRRPIELLSEWVSLDKRWSLIHATHANADEIALMAKAKLIVGLCPSTEANLGDGIFNMRDYLVQQGLWGIGSDSHISLNVAEELRWLEYGQRLLHQKRTLLASDKEPHSGTWMYKKAISGGAQSLQVDLGKIKPGKRADWLQLNDDGFGEPNFVFDRWIFANAVERPHRVMVAGKWRFEREKSKENQELDSSFRKLLQRIKNNRHKGG